MLCCVVLCCVALCCAVLCCVTDLIFILFHSAALSVVVWTVFICHIRYQFDSLIKPCATHLHNITEVAKIVLFFVWGFSRPRIIFHLLILKASRGVKISFSWLVVGPSSSSSKELGLSTSLNKLL